MGIQVIAAPPSFDFRDRWKYLFLMKKVSLGLNGPEVSELCLGTLPFGTRVDKKTSYQLLDDYAAAGGSFLDTANNYSMWHAGGKGGESESMLGDWMADRGNRREMFVATKAGFNTPDTGGRSLAPALIRRELEKSLKRLKTDYVDLFYAHVDCRDDDLEETLEMMDTLVREGRARHLGASNFTAWRLEKAQSLQFSRGWSPFIALQQRHTYLRPGAGASFAPQLSTSDEILDYVRSTPDLRLLAYSPLLNGAYTREDRDFPAQYDSAEKAGRLAVLAEVAEESGAGINQLIFAWMLAQESPVIPLIAPTTEAQLQDSLGASGVRLSADQVRRLKA